MAIYARTSYTAVCDVTTCGAKFDQYGDYLHDDHTPHAALSQVDSAPDTHWRRVGDTIVCPRNDTAHDQLRGGESPALLTLSPDAMTAHFPAGRSA